ncbi:hypothetical protein Dsin_016129 [Dipteronia sinensis]|uniref:Peptidase S8/S53 domain-containing protein n=1 Tax=Dipteronia sinensis TaxID=43782 RepID=A0AAE0ADF3_9ROSI|nr:hypothetical protein Dsin_016129 [Dipteronia sinensis]
MQFSEGVERNRSCRSQRSNGGVSNKEFDCLLGSLYATLAAGRIILILWFAKSESQKKQYPWCKCVHLSSIVAGIAALIKSAHQDCSPAVIRSALVNTGCATIAFQTGTDGMNAFEEGPTLLLARKQTCSTWVVDKLMRSGWRVRMGGEFVFGSRGTTKSGLNFVGLYREQTGSDILL